MKATGQILTLIVLLLTGVSRVVAQPAEMPPVPPPAVWRSPVESFRTLLLLPPKEQQEQLAARSADARNRLAAKIREYQALTPDERELRLKATELRWYLKPLMTMPASNRTAQLSAIPTNLLAMVQVRLEQWDRLPPAVQQLLLTNTHGAAYLASGRATSLYPPLPSESLRRKVQERFEQLFELTSAEKERVLATLSEAEQLQMQKTLAAFEKLNPGQRSQCLRSFAKFSSLSPAERQDFLKNAARWAEMPPAERQSWRDLVSRAPDLPPLPQLTPRPPPLPPVVPHRPVPTNTGG